MTLHDLRKEHVKRSSNDLRNQLDQLNVIKKHKMSDDITYGLDGGATVSILKNKEHLINYQPTINLMNTALKNSKALKCTGVKDLVLNSEITLEGVYYCADVAYNEKH